MKNIALLEQEVRRDWKNLCSSDDLEVKISLANKYNTELNTIKIQQALLRIFGYIRKKKKRKDLDKNDYRMWFYQHPYIDSYENLKDILEGETEDFVCFLADYYQMLVSNNQDSKSLVKKYYFILRYRYEKFDLKTE